MKKLLKIGLDVDDTLMDCNRYACECLRKEGIDADYNDITLWGPVGTNVDLRMKYFSDPSFVSSQPVFPGAVKFVNELTKRAEVFIITAVPSNVMGERAMAIERNFPMIPKENILIGTRKDVVKFDVVLDDGAHNILSSQCDYPVLFRKPWNSHMSGCLSVNSYDDFISFIDNILLSKYREENENEHKLVVLIGPSASGKTEILNHLVEDGAAVKGISYTTRKPRPGEYDGDTYHFVTNEVFKELDKKGFFFETTHYADSCYGSNKEEIENMLKKNSVVMITDILGAITLKKTFPQTVITYVKRKREDIIRSIISRDISVDEKTKRILSLELEKKNELLADACVDNTGSIESSVGYVKEHIL